MCHFYVISHILMQFSHAFKNTCVWPWIFGKKLCIAFFFAFWKWKLRWQSENFPFCKVTRKVSLNQNLALLLANSHTLQLYLECAKRKFACRVFQLRRLNFAVVLIHVAKSSKKKIFFTFFWHEMATWETLHFSRARVELWLNFFMYDYKSEKAI